MKASKELIEIIGTANISSEKLLKLEELLEKVQYEAYSDGYNDGYEDGETQQPT